MLAKPVQRSSASVRSASARSAGSASDRTWIAPPVRGGCCSSFSAANRRSGRPRSNTPAARYVGPASSSCAIHAPPNTRARAIAACSASRVSAMCTRRPPLPVAPLITTGGSASASSRWCSTAIPRAAMCATSACLSRSRCCCHGSVAGKHARAEISTAPSPPRSSGMTWSKPPGRAKRRSSSTGPEIHSTLPCRHRALLPRSP